MTRVIARIPVGQRQYHERLNDTRSELEKDTDAKIAQMVQLLNDVMSVEDVYKFQAERDAAKDHYERLAICRLWQGRYDDKVKIAQLGELVRILDDENQATGGDIAAKSIHVLQACGMLTDIRRRELLGLAKSYPRHSERIEEILK